MRGTTFGTTLVSNVVRAVRASSQSASDLVYWSQVAAADEGYDDDLPHDAIPSEGEGYNSNGYVHGLVNFTNRSADVSQVSGLWGWGRPVPAEAFQPE